MLYYKWRKIVPRWGIGTVPTEAISSIQLKNLNPNGIKIHIVAQKIPDTSGISLSKR